jgi:hypothetical protein
MSNSNFWQLVFTQSKVNGAEYFGDRLPSNSWDWPKDTFLQKRLNELKKRRPETTSNAPEANHAPVSSPNRKRRRTYQYDPNWSRSVDSLSCVERH